jgi:multidrug efflux pump subunit AcrB
MLVEFQPGTDVSAAAQRIRSLASAVAGVRVTVDEIYEGPTVEHPIHINFVGDDYEHLAKYAEQAKAILREQPGALNVTDTLEKTVPVTQVRVDGEKAFARGVTPAAVGMALRTVYGGDKVTEIREGDDTLEVTFDASGTSVDAIEQTPVRGAVGGIHPIDAASNVQVKRAHAQLRHRDQRRVVTVFADVAGNALASKILEGAMPRLKAIALDPQSTMTFAGEAAETEKSFRGLGISALLAILIMLLVLVMMFDSLTLAAVIFAAVPYGLIGAVLGLVVTGYPFGFFSFLGLIALLGVYVNHKIYLVDRVRDLMGRGVSLEKAILDAGIDRLRPVVLTALTAVLGLVPLTLSGSPLFTPFGWVNIFGLVTSIPLSMILVPAFVALAFRYGRKNLIPVTVMPEPSRTSHPSNPSSPSDGSDRRHGRSSFRREGRGSAHVRVASSREFLGNVSLDRTLLGPTLLAPAAAPSVPAAKDSHPSAPSSRGQGTSFLRPSPRFFRPN